MCFGNYYIDERLALIVSGIGIFIVLTLCILAARHFQSNEAVQVPFKVLFITAALGSLLSMIGSIISIVICPSLGEDAMYAVMWLGSFTGTLLLLSSLCISFVLRLYVTFEDTLWSISKSTVYIYMVLVFSFFMLEIVCAMMVCINIIERGTYFNITWFVAIAYIAASIWPVYRFVHNLIALAKARAMNLSTERLSIDSGVSEKQQVLINLSSKYILLFVVAICSTISSCTIVGIMRFGFSHPLHPGAVLAMDSVINFICLYLYHSFAASLYDRYCSRLDGCCKVEMSKSVRLENIESISKRSRASTNVSPSATIQIPHPKRDTDTGGQLVILYEDEKSVTVSPSSISNSPSGASTDTEIVCKI